MRFRLCALLLLLLGWAGEAPIFGQAVTTVTLASLPSGSVASGTVVTLMASVNDSGGPVLGGQVSFFDGTKAIGVIPVVRNAAANYAPGTATLRKIFGPGAHSIRAVYGGTSSEQTSTSATGTLTVAAGAGTPSAGLVYGTTRYFGQMSRVESVVLADVNNDGVLDLVTPQFGFSNVAISLGDSLHPGTFLPPTLLNVPSTAMDFCVVSDLNGDGLPDLVTTGADGDAAYVVLQDSAHPGSFLSPKPVGFSETKALVADMNHDGIPDLVLVNTAITIRQGDPLNPGSFLPGGTTPITGSDIRTAAAVDVNGDGLPDIVIGNYNAQTVSVWLNDAAHPGQLLAKTDYPAGGSMYDLAIGDMNGDGLPDVVLGNVFAGVTILLDNAANPGQLLAPRSYAASATPGGGRSLGVAVGDIDGDGVLDVVSGNFGPAFDVLLGRGDGTLGPAAAYVTGPTPDWFEATAMAVGDVDGDGLTDVAVGQFYQNSAQIFTHQSIAPSLLITATDLTQSASVVSVGSAFTITIKVSSLSGVPSGSVTFYDGSGATTTTTTLILDSTGTATTASSSLSAGFHSFSAFYPGNSSFAPSIGFSVGVTVNNSPTAHLTLTGTPNPATVGQVVTFTATVSGTGAAPTGVVSFLDSGGSALAVAPIGAGGAAVFQTSSLILGTHTIQAIYSGDSNYPSQRLTMDEVIGYPPVVLGLRSSLNPAVAGQTIQFTATVTSPGPGATGTVTFLDGGRQLGQTALTGGSAVLSINSLNAGTHSIQANYSGDSNYGSQTTALSEVVNPGPTTTVLSVSPNPAFLAQAVSLNATVTGVAPASGTVTFFDGANAIGSSALDANGSAILTTAGLQLGTHALTAAFGANSSGAGSTSQVVNEVVIVNPRDFELTSNGALMVRTQHHGAATINVTPSGGLSDTVLISCGTLPIYATCAVAPGQVGVSGGTAQTVSVQIETDQVPGYARLKAGWGGALACVLPWLLFGWSSRRRVVQRFMVAMLLAAASGAVIGCSGRYPLATPPGTYNIVISGHGQTTGLNRTTTLTLVVTP